MNDASGVLQRVHDPSTSQSALVARSATGRCRPQAYQARCCSSTGEDLPKELIEYQWISRLTLPYRQNLPPHGHQSSSIRLIPGDIPYKLFGPELCTGRGRSRKSASRMPVPETSVDKHDRAVSGENEVRPARESPQVQPVPEAAGMEITPHQHLRASVLATDRRHHSRAGCRINYVCHADAQETGQHEVLPGWKFAPGTIADCWWRQGLLGARLSLLFFP